MKETINSISLRFETSIQSKSEKDFYLNLYEYFDYVIKNLELDDIFERSKEEYLEGHSNIWNHYPRTDNEADNLEIETLELEKFNLYAVGAVMYERIYLPIKRHKEDNGKSIKAMILLHGYKYLTNIPKIDKEKLERFSRWYEGKRSEYESNLKRFHIMLIDELDNYQKIANKTLEFDKEKSVLRIGEKDVKISLKNDKTNSHYILEYIFKKDLKEPSDYVDIIESKFPWKGVNNHSMYRACKDINDKVEKQAGIANFLIVKSGNSGYTQINPEYL